MAKKSKASVEYTDDHGTSSEQCAKCKHYVNATTCAVVAGKINPAGWCDQFSRDRDWYDKREAA